MPTQKQGEIAVLNEKIFTSVRRWENSGILRTTLRNQLLLASYVTKHKIFNSRYSREKPFKMHQRGNSGRNPCSECIEES